MMGATVVFAIGSLSTLVIGMSVVWYLRRPLRNILIELCGNEQRAEFWAAFSAVAVGVVPVIFALACRPAPGPGAPAVFELADQIKWGLVGMMGSVMTLGWVIGRSIARWELRAKPNS
jgi:di/tricarboxylate transporter